MPFITPWLFFRENEDQIAFTDQVQPIAGLPFDEGGIARLAQLPVERADLGVQRGDLAAEPGVIVMQSPQPPQDSVEDETGAEENQAHDEHASRAVQESTEGIAEAFEGHDSSVHEFARAQNWTEIQNRPGTILVFRNRSQFQVIRTMPA